MNRRRWTDGVTPRPAVAFIKIHPIKSPAKNIFKIFSTLSSNPSKSFSFRAPNFPEIFPRRSADPTLVPIAVLFPFPSLVLCACRFPPKPLATVADRPNAAAHARGRLPPRIAPTPPSFSFPSPLFFFSFSFLPSPSLSPFSHALHEQSSSRRPPSAPPPATGHLKGPCLVLVIE